MNRRRVLIGCVAFLILCLIAPWAAPYNPLQEVGEALAPPSADHLLGVDWIGRDILSRVLHGGARTLIIGVLALFAAILPGILIGVSAGWYGGWWDWLVVKGLNAFLAVPGLLLALVILTLVGSGAGQVAFAAGIAQFPMAAQISRAAGRSARSFPFVEAARGIGVTERGILIRHVLPNLARTLIGISVVSLSWTILSASVLHFLGFGGDPAIPEWGAMLAEARQVYRIAPHVALSPGIAITILLLVVNILAEYITHPSKA
ncbi:MAG: ABC transporter permease [Anaerolinea sp.]|nr:ABC transporter permease [Anaerolinea sp.]